MSPALFPRQPEPLFDLCDRCADRATEFDRWGGAWCADCAEHVEALRMESAGISPRRSRMEAPHA